MISYTLPDFTQGLTRNLLFLRLARENPECFLDKVEIESIYGCFPSCILNGGRAFIRERYTPTQIEQTFSLLQEQGLTTRLTFTNMLAEVSHLDDEYVSTILSIAERYPTEVIVYSDAIAEELRHRYGFKCVLSTTREIQDLDTLNQATKRYDYVVLNYNKNKHLDFIEGIEDRDKIEIMVNEFCAYGCPHREAHYLHNSEDQMQNTLRPFTCFHEEKEAGEYFKHRPEHPVFLTDEQVRDLHDTYGIRYFKIVGRGVPGGTTLESYVYHLIKPEHRTSIKRFAQEYLDKRKYHPQK